MITIVTAFFKTLFTNRSSVNRRSFPTQLAQFYAVHQFTRSISFRFAAVFAVLLRSFYPTLRAGFITFVRGLLSAVDTHSVLSSTRKHFLLQLTLSFLLLWRKLPRRGKGIVDAVGIRAIKAVAYFAVHSFFAILSFSGDVMNANPHFLRSSSDVVLI